MPTQLSVYNGALRIVKERRLGSLTESRESRRLLDDIWSDGQTEGAVAYCLQEGQWTFATRTVLIDYSPSVTPSFGYRYGFSQPEDMVRPVGMFCDEYCKQPLLEYSDERRHWYCDLPSFYARYVSNDATYGADTSLWTEKFTKMVEAYMALEIAPNLTNSDNVIQLAEAAWKRAKLEAASDDAMRKPTAFPPPGRWLNSRHGENFRRSLWNGRS